MKAPEGPSSPQPLAPLGEPPPTEPPASGALAVGAPVSLPVASAPETPPPPSVGDLPPGAGQVPRQEFPEERPARLHLDSPETVAQWERRAEWLEAEAQVQPDAATRGRLLLAASEVRALLGAGAEARRLAEQAQGQSAAPALAVRQARALGLLEGDPDAVRRSLQAEARSARAPAARAHAHYVAAELARLRRREDPEVEQHLEAAEQSDPSDHRATLQRLARQLARSQRPPDVRFRPDEAWRSLRLAAGQLRQLRGSEAPRLGPQDLGAQPLLDAQRAILRGRLSEAADAIGPLQVQAGLGGAVRWLVLLWRTLPKAQPEEILDALRDLVADHPGRLELRTWAARALAARRPEWLREVLERAAVAPTAEGEAPAFSPAERSALGALGIDAPASAEDRLDGEPAGAPLAAALQRIGAGPVPLPGGAAAEFALGRASVTFPELAATEPFLAALTGSPWSAALRLEQHRQARDPLGLARELTRLMTRPKEHAESQFIAGVLAETAGDLAGADEHYRAALGAETVREAAVRALGVRAADVSGLLRSLAAHATDGSRRALLLTEALLHMEMDAPEFDSVAEDAWRAYPELGLAGDLGEIAARMRGDGPGVERWLGRLREHARGPQEVLFSTLREARFLAVTDPPAACSRLRPAAAEQAALDASLLHAIERLDPGSKRERADLRMRAAELASQRRRQHLLSEAADLYDDVGDREAALGAVRAMAGAVGLLRLEAWTTDAGDLAALGSRWQRELEQTEDTEVGAELEMRLLRLARAAGQPERSAHWADRLLAREQLPVLALRLLEIESMTSGREAALEGVAARWCEELGGPEAAGHLFLAARLAIDRGAHAESAPFAERAASLATPPLWALRLASAHARRAGDDRRLLACARELRERSRQPLDAATLSLRAAEAAARLGDFELASAEIQRALELTPEHIVSVSLRAELLARQRRFAEAAEAFEALAATAEGPARSVEASYRAALIWLDRLGERERAAAVLDEALAQRSVPSGLRERVRELRDRAAAPPDAVPASEAPDEPSSAAELARANALRQAGQGAEARALVQELLQREPDDAEARHLSALLYFDAAEWRAAEHEWQILVSAPRPRAARLAALRGLAGLYERELPNPERACGVAREILADDPDDDRTRRQLICQLESTGQNEEALAQQRTLLERAAGDDERRQSLLELVRILERTRQGAPEAEALLEQAHRTWPESTEVLEAQFEHYRRQGNLNTARALLERATHGVRHAVAAGRLEPSLLRVLEHAARLGGDPEAARAAQVVAAAIEGQASRVSGAGSLAAHPRFDDLTAPAPLSAAFRRLLYGAGAAMERAYAADLRALEAAPLPEAQAAQVRAVAAAFGLENARVLMSEKVGCDCIGIYSEPCTLVFGHELLAQQNPRLRDFLLLRALKLAQVNACALSRMSPTELWSAVAGFLSCFAPAWQAEGADAQRLVAARNRIRPHVTATLDPELSAMTPALTSSIVPQAAQLGDALWRWATRVALFGVGDLGVAFESLWGADNQRPPPPRELGARIRWIAGSSLARDLVSYGISEAYTEARRRAGLLVPPG